VSVDAHYKLPRIYLDHLEKGKLFYRYQPTKLEKNYIRTIGVFGYEVPYQEHFLIVGTEMQVPKLLFIAGHLDAQQRVHTLLCLVEPAHSYVHRNMY